MYMYINYHKLHSREGLHTHKISHALSDIKNIMKYTNKSFYSLFQTICLKMLPTGEPMLKASTALGIIFKNSKSMI